jgi:putative colanic acid biosynthesis glycosyltransferase
MEILVLLNSKPIKRHVNKGKFVVKVSIITVVKDHVAGLRVTHGSLKEQNFSNWEMFIVVGESRDLTLSEAMRYQGNDSRIRVIEQQDTGIYGAMNLGLAAATGEFIWFMNAGDRFATPTVLSNGINALQESTAGIAIGGYQIDEKGGPHIYSDGPITALNFAFSRRGGCHQAMVFRTKLIKELGGFNTLYSLAADFELVLKIILKWKAVRVSQLFALIEPGGLADQGIFLVHAQKHQIRKSLLGGLVTFTFSVFWTGLARLKIFTRRVFKNSS